MLDDDVSRKQDNDSFQSGGSIQARRTDQLVEKDTDHKGLDGDIPEFNAGDTGEDYGETPTHRPVLFRVVALFTALSFIGFIALTTLPPLKAPLADLVTKSTFLRKGMDERLLQAVVKIEVVSHKPGSTVLVEQKSGTGFNIDPAGVIVTNHHVVDGALTIAVAFQDGHVYRATRWYGRPEYDLAVIALEAKNRPAAALDLSARPAPGDEVRVIGNPLGYNNIVVTGKVLQYLAVRDKPGEVFSMDAPIYPGNSGSPVLDRSGRVVGVVFATMRSEENGQERALGLAVPIDDVLRLAESYPPPDIYLSKRKTARLHHCLY